VELDSGEAQQLFGSSQKMDVNTGSLSETMDCGISCSRKMSEKKACATDSAKDEPAG
jgi:hypothetical protein